MLSYLDYRQKILLFLIILFSYAFGLIERNILVVPVVIISFICAISYAFSYKKAFFAKYLYGYLFFYILSFLSCSYFEGQSFMQTFVSADAVQYFTVLSYFCFVIGDFSSLDIEKSLTVAYFILCPLFFIEWLVYPSPFLNLCIDYDGRIQIYGQVISYFFLFWYFGLYLRTNGIKYLFLSLPALFIILIGGYRTLLGVSLLLLALYTLYEKKLASVKYILFLGVLVIFLLQLPFVSDILAQMMERQKDGANFANSDYIRLIQWNYFTTEHFHSPLEYILGSGVPNPSTIYGRQFYEIEEYVGPILGWRDWGTIGLSWIIGLPTVLCLVIPSVYIIFSEIPKEYLAFKFFYMLLLLTGITTVEFYAIGSYWLHGLFFYWYEQIKFNNKYVR